MIHRIIHWLRWNRVTPEIWWVWMGNRKKMMSGNRCVICGELTDIHPSGIELEYYDA